jgi:hypothetical protein
MRLRRHSHISTKKIPTLARICRPRRQAGAVCRHGRGGANPARIIPAWQQFVTDHASPDRQVRGIGEPIWSGRSPVELVECQRHEQLLNVAFAGAPAWWLVCPYDAEALGPAVIDEARRSHPYLARDGVRYDSAAYRGVEAEARPFDAPLPPPPGLAAVFTFDAAAGSLAALRALVDAEAAAAGSGRTRPVSWCWPPRRSPSTVCAMVVAAGVAGRRRAGVRGPRPRPAWRPAGGPPPPHARAT